MSDLAPAEGDEDLGAEDAEPAELEEDGGSAEPRPLDWFYPMPVSRLIVFGLLGGALYSIYWFYKNWAAYRRAWGYSREPFWRDVFSATGYRVSALWRALLSGFYCFSLFPAVQRECKANRVAGPGVPFLLAALFGCLALWASVKARSPVIGLVGPTWALVPVQFAINRLNAQFGRRRHDRISGAEVVCVLFGAFSVWGPKLW
ncbi:MAG: hypothetical protein ABW061_01030 [Polyangiaceae bacterium]